MKLEKLLETSSEPVITKLLPEDRFFHRIAGLHELIQRRAYHLFEEAGFRHGHDLEDWLRAESQLLMPVPVEVSDAKNTITVKAALPGYQGKDIEIHAHPLRLFITGERISAVGQEGSEGEKVKTAGSETILQRVFREVELPEEIDPDRVQATLNNGVLQIVLAKVKAKVEQKVAKAIQSAA